MFLQQIERKPSKEYLVTILAVKESFERFSCLGFIFEKTVMLKRRSSGGGTGYSGSLRGNSINLRGNTLT